MTAHLVRGDARMLPLATGIVQCVVTSPPYFNLRAYQTNPVVWGGRDGCEHEWTSASRVLQKGTISEKQSTHKGNNGAGFEASTGVCALCNAMRCELGSEPDPQSFVAHLVEVMRECWRVLRDDGVAFVNIGDSMAGSHGNGYKQTLAGKTNRTTGGTENFDLGRRNGRSDSGTRPKSLLLVPERLAIALSDDGWIIRSRIAWCKAAPMPESTKDRPTSAWEHIWMLTKQGRYYWNQDAVRVPYTASSLERLAYPVQDVRSGTVNGTAARAEGSYSVKGAEAVLRDDLKPNQAGRNLWNYWLLSPDSYAGAHFATYPRELVRRCVVAASREGDVVLDPFSGSGTTAFVAASLGRVGIGVELSAEYTKQARYGRLAQDFLPFDAPPRQPPLPNHGPMLAGDAG